jgi:metallophosphoesterase superfamily enzyme
VVIYVEDGDWIVAVSDMHGDTRHSFRTRGYAIDFADRQRMRLKLPKHGEQPKVEAAPRVILVEDPTPSEY